MTQQVNKNIQLKKKYLPFYHAIADQVLHLSLIARSIYAQNEEARDLFCRLNKTAILLDQLSEEESKVQNSNIEPAPYIWASSNFPPVDAHNSKNKHSHLVRLQNVFDFLENGHEMWEFPSSYGQYPQNYQKYIKIIMTNLSGVSTVEERYGYSYWNLYSALFLFKDITKELYRWPTLFSKHTERNLTFASEAKTWVDKIYYLIQPKTSRPKITISQSSRFLIENIIKKEENNEKLSITEKADLADFKVGLNSITIKYPGKIIKDAHQKKDNDYIDYIFACINRKVRESIYTEIEKSCAVNYKLFNGNNIKEEELNLLDQDAINQVIYLHKKNSKSLVDRVDMIKALTQSILAYDFYNNPSELPKIEGKTRKDSACISSKEYIKNLINSFTIEDREIFSSTPNMTALSEKSIIRTLRKIEAHIKNNKNESSKVQNEYIDIINEQQNEYKLSSINLIIGFPIWKCQKK